MRYAIFFFLRIHPLAKLWQDKILLSDDTGPTLVENYYRSDLRQTGVHAAVRLFWDGSQLSLRWVDARPDFRPLVRAGIRQTVGRQAVPLSGQR